MGKRIYTSPNGLWRENDSLLIPGGIANEPSGRVALRNAESLAEIAINDSVGEAQVYSRYSGSQMRVQRNFPVCWRYLLLGLLLAAVFWRIATVRNRATASTTPAELQQQVTLPFRFVAFGDTRFTNSQSERVSSGEIRRAIVRAIGNDKPVFVSIGGDIV